jgi:hypothetical protein
MFSTHFNDELNIFIIYFFTKKKKKKKKNPSYLLVLRLRTKNKKDQMNQQKGPFASENGIGT